MQFVALDLETTGLNTNTDTIIEIAAIRFSIELEGDIFVMKNPEERSMLINPGRHLEQEVTMITGINNDMLIGKPDFNSVQDKVRDFIGNAIIIGHNVLFDITMLESHGIDLHNNTIIDTFELSEIFSQDIESLNLGFLANRYGLIDPTEEEHRALTDTKVSIRLLLRYLGEIRKLEGDKKRIWNIFASRDLSGTLNILSKICHYASDIETNIEYLFTDLIAHKVKKNSNTESFPIRKETHKRILCEISGNPEEELHLIKNTFKTHTHILIVSPGYRTTVWLSKYLTANNIENMVTIPHTKWCSVLYMREILMSNESYSRKKLILILKIAFWMTKTETGLIDELKFYGDERTMIDIFRSQENEYSHWRNQYEAKIENMPILISDIYTLENIEKNSRYILIKDISLLEDIVRRKESQEISFDKLTIAIEQLNGDSESTEARIHLSDMISMIRSIYESIPNRPTGPAIMPPGNYGETYFITQKILWNEGHKWLIHATKTLNQGWKKWKQNNIGTFPREIQMNIEYIDKMIGILVKYHTFREENLNMIIHMNEGTTTATLIPRNVVAFMNPILNGSLAYGMNISLHQTKSFLIREYGYSEAEFNGIKSINEAPIKVVYSEYHPTTIKPGTVILTTSQKHARDIGQALRKIYDKDTDILIQGLSGGKGKMLSIFKTRIKKAILIGIIDTWRDDYDLWNTSHTIIIAKLPFDPPTDPYFLARTVGMSNNFSEYSEPIVIIRLNTLVERICESGYKGNISLTDPRLLNTEWGKRIIEELL